jgi:hypothetical protein
MGCCAAFAAATGFANDAAVRFLADFDIKILRFGSRRRRAATTEAPPRSISRRGRISGRLDARNVDSTAPSAAECQSFLDNVVAQFGVFADFEVAAECPRITIRQSKTNQEGQGVTIAIARSSAGRPVEQSSVGLLLPRRAGARTYSK